MIIHIEMIDTEETRELQKRLIENYQDAEAYDKLMEFIDKHLQTYFSGNHMLHETYVETVQANTDEDKEYLLEY